jgi:hypothetical protein
MLDVRAMSILDAAELLGGSTRLVNALRFADYTGILSLPTVSDYLEMGPAGEEMLLTIPNLGRGTARELWVLLSRSRDRTLAAKAGANSDVPVELTNARSDLTVPQEDTPRNIEEVLAELSERERSILARRFGLDGREAETLAQVGESLGVTRERVRQIESKSIKRLRRRFKIDLENYLHQASSEVWGRVSSESLGAAASTERVNQDALTPLERFAVSVLGERLSKVVESVAREIDGGYLAHEIDDAAYANARKRLQSHCMEAVFPFSIDSMQGPLDRALLAAIELDPVLVQFLGYLCNRSPTRRTRRAIRVHRQLRENPGVPVPLRKLHSEYYERNSDDQCSTRDLLIVMNEARHLFLNLYEEGWAAFGPAIKATNRHESGLTMSDEDKTVEQEPNDEGSTTVAGELRRILRSGGPMGFDDLRERFMSHTKGAFSRSSVGPILLLNADFIRLAPGIYGLEEHLNDAKQLVRTQNLLLDDKQLALYCQARWAKEPAEMYPMWTPAMEKAWADWALSTGAREHLSSLLCIANIESWPVGDAERTKWRARRDIDAAFRLRNRNPIALTETVPTFQDVLRAAMFCRCRGGLSWISANRVRGLRVDDRHAHSILAFLVWLRVLKPAEHWQDWHSLHPDASSIIDALVSSIRPQSLESWPQVIRTRYLQKDFAYEGWMAEYDIEELVTLTIQPENLPEGAGIGTQGESLDDLLKAVAKKRAILNADLQ